MVDTELPPDPRIKTQLEQGIINQFMADVAANGSWPKMEKSRSGQSQTHRTDRRGGRSYSEELPDPQTALPPEVLSDEQIAERQAVLDGSDHQAAKAAGILATHNRIMKTTEGESVSYRIARELAAQEKYAREQHRLGRTV